ncbi:hypothetical protein C8R42DRAFT_667333 [Lentinula raphanica]|nr:hypothetical protein C8R42DRAFT_667333 [Lentinula raphanica]
MLQYAEELVDEDIRDEDWVPDDLWNFKTDRTSTYATGPDISKASARTQRRRKNERKGQKSLTLFGFTGGNVTSNGFRTLVGPTITATPNDSLPSHFQQQSISPIDITSDSDEPQSQPREGHKLPVLDCEKSPPLEPISVENHEESVEPLPTLDGDDNHAPIAETWEDELDECAGLDKPTGKRGWEQLREEIKADLALAKKKFMPLSQINQLLILRNFATLQLKNIGRIEASKAIALQWHEKEGVHFARRVRSLVLEASLLTKQPEMLLALGS